MPRQTRVHTRLPWNGGLNTAVDPGVIPDNDLVQADDVVFATSGARIKREGRDFFDTSIPTLLARLSSGTTRTLIFRSEITSATDDILVLDEKITIAGDSNYAGNFTIATVVTNTPSAKSFVDGDVTVGTDSISETAHGFYTGMQGNLTSTGTLPAGLVTSVTYFIIATDADNYKLALTEVLALAGTAVDITAATGGGTHTLTPVVISNNAITYTATGSFAETITDVVSETIVKNYSYIGVHDFWYVDSGVKVQRLVAVSDEPKLYFFDANGNRKEIDKDAGATALSSPTKVNFLTANNILIIGFDATANTPKKYAPAISTDWFDLGGPPPNFEFMELHLGRVFANDKTDLDRLHYSPPGDVETWNGNGDSGAIDISFGDGDPVGLTAIGRPFKGHFYIAKKTKIIDLLGDAPENFRIEPVTEGLGMVTNRSVIPVDFDDLVYVSDRGIHSLIATDTQGDFSSNFLSRKIQPTFNSFNPARLDKIQGAYLPDLNSFAFTVSSETSTINDDIYLFNILEQEWYKWPNANAQSLTTRLFNDRERRFVWGTDAGRIVQGQNGTQTDFGSTGPSYIIKTGSIYPGENPQSLKLFKKLTLYFKAKGDFTFTVKYKIDNFAENTLTFAQATGEDLLGSTFILGQSLLGIPAVFAPQTRDIEGIGRGIVLTIESSGTARPIEIYGYSLEYEDVDINQEVI